MARPNLHHVTEHHIFGRISPQYVQSVQSPFTATLETDRVGLAGWVDQHYVTRYERQPSKIGSESHVCNVHDLVYPKEWKSRREERHSELGRHPGHGRTRWRTVYENHDGSPREKESEHSKKKKETKPPLKLVDRSKPLYDHPMGAAWPGMDMLINNSHTYIHGTTNTPEIQLDRPLALKMG